MSMCKTLVGPILIIVGTYSVRMCGTRGNDLSDTFSRGWSGCVARRTIPTYELIFVARSTFLMYKILMCSSVVCFLLQGS